MSKQRIVELETALTNIKGIISDLSIAAMMRDFGTLTDSFDNIEMVIDTALQPGEDDGDQET